MGLFLVFVIIALLVGGLPAWEHSRDWGYGPSGALALILALLLVFILSGRIDYGF